MNRRFTSCGWSQHPSTTVASSWIFRGAPRRRFVCSPKGRTPRCSLTQTAMKVKDGVWADTLLEPRGGERIQNLTEGLGQLRESPLSDSSSEIESAHSATACYADVRSLRCSKCGCMPKPHQLCEVTMITASTGNKPLLGGLSHNSPPARWGLMNRQMIHYS